MRTNCIRKEEVSKNSKLSLNLKKLEKKQIKSKASESKGILNSWAEINETEETYNTENQWNRYSPLWNYQ